jgi:AAA+ ATPase superfamily predicted ATPase
LVSQDKRHLFVTPLGEVVTIVLEMCFSDPGSDFLDYCISDPGPVSDPAGNFSNFLISSFLEDFFEKFDFFSACQSIFLQIHFGSVTAWIRNGTDILRIRPKVSDPTGSGSDTTLKFLLIAKIRELILLGKQCLPYTLF